MKKGESIAIWETGEAGWHDQRKAVRQDDTASWDEVAKQCSRRERQDGVLNLTHWTVLYKGLNEKGSNGTKILKT
ncbi:hypothetical protein MTR_8g063430 [Medicago truncatula]|uniref:Uncharacterized protein n=1 Tax=Medicago truncatula TaxID=3880 RepID=G7LFI1_MEDTR|nr:hypothetical protein MTR_8g063430 [Medicago truncatula]